MLTIPHLCSPLISYLCSPLISYKKNYEIQSSMFKWLDQKTEKNKWIKFPTICAFGVSNLITVVTRITGVVESFFCGVAILLTTPFSEKKIERAVFGLNQMFFESSKCILRILFMSIELFVDGFCVLFEPKFYILTMSEFMKVNLEHAQKNSIGSPEHSTDISEVQEIAYTKLLRYQGVTK